MYIYVFASEDQWYRQGSECLHIIFKAFMYMYIHMFIQDKSSTKSDRSESRGKGDKKSTSKQKGKKENDHLSSEKRRDQPLLLEFESLFESLQVCMTLCLQYIPLMTPRTSSYSLNRCKALKKLSLGVLHCC